MSGTWWFAAGAVLAAPVWLVLAIWLTRRTWRNARKLSQRARGRELLAELGQLAGGLAHEIKNPLSTINVNLQLVSEDNIERIRDITPYISETKFEAYLRIPADAYKDDLFEAYDEAADASQVSA